MQWGLSTTGKKQELWERIQAQARRRWQAQHLTMQLTPLPTPQPS
jgi:hypothetical protein